MEIRQYDVSGMSCAACSARVEKAVSAVPGVTSCAVSLLTNSMGVTGDAAPEAIVAAVEAAGYGASPKGESAPTTAAEDALSDKETPILRRRLIASVGFLLVLMYFSMGHMLWGFPIPKFLENPAAMGLWQLLLTAAVMVIGQKFFVSGFRAILRRSPNMDTLVALGASAAFLYSTYALFAVLQAQASGDTAAAAHFAHEYYFESAAMIPALITVGKMLEARAKGKTTDALRSLMQLSPPSATVIRDGTERVVPLAEVQVEDMFLVRPGESIPVDGVILDGESAVDESALSGESIPVDKGIGDSVSAATLNRSGVLRCRATRVGEDTTLSQIIRMVSDAAATKAPIAKIADRVASVFVPVVIGIALIATLAWLLAGQSIGFALARGISVLVISCPCALGLATPVAVTVGSGVGAKNGILFKTAASLEAAGRIDTVVLDKTGTITAGHPRLTDLLPFDGVTKEELFSTALSLEENSEHPLARAIQDAAEEQGIVPRPVTAFEVLSGSGLRAMQDGAELLGGSLAFMKEKTTLPPDALARADALSEAGKTPLLFARDGRSLGMIAVSDVLREDSADAIRELCGMGIRVVMLSGDNERTARAIAREAGIDEVIAGVRPDGKEQHIRKLKQTGKVAMVGDGINDAPALTRADVGIAIGAGTDIAIDAADVVLMRDSLRDVPAAIRLSRASLRNIRENLFWAFFYNAVGIPLAAGLFIPSLGWELSPMFGAAAMSLSSFCVVTNALRLNLLHIHDARHDRKIRKIKFHHTKETIPMKKTMHIEGMMCVHCEARVKKTLEALPEVESAVVSHEAGTAVLTLNAAITDDALKAAVEAQDYKVNGIE